MTLSPKAIELLENQVTIILGTSTPEGQPNIAPMALYWVKDGKQVIFGDIWLKTVVEHVKANSKVQICFWDEASKETHKANGEARYETEGPAVDLAREELQAAGEGEHNALKGAVVIDLD